jgi:hypothetical protein
VAPAVYFDEGGASGNGRELPLQKLGRLEWCGLVFGAAKDQDRAPANALRSQWDPVRTTYVISSRSASGIGRRVIRGFNSSMHSSAVWPGP